MGDKKNPGADNRKEMGHSPIKDTRVCIGRPRGESPKRSPGEMAVYDFLDGLGIPYTRLDHEAIFTMEGCREAGELLGISLCKNLFLCNAQRTRFYLLLMPGEKRFVTRDFCRQIESPRLSFAPGEYMEKFLGLTPGSVSVMGLMNDRENHVELVIDEDVLREEYLGCHPCVNTSSIRLSMRDMLEKFLPAAGHDFRVVRLKGTSQEAPEKKSGPFTVREMRLEDYEGLRALWMTIKGFGIRSIDDSRQGVERFLNRNPGASVVAVREDGTVVGGILCGHDGRRGCLYHVCVREDCRRHGIGKAMVVYCMNALQAEGINKVSLIAFTQNDVGNAFWRRIGWTRREDLNYYDFTLNEANITAFNQ